ncbi:MAG: winged helix-turn-helix domain-containing protein [Pyrinomonadaceae bacterium]
MSLENKNLYEFGEFRLDPSERELFRGDQPIELTPKAFELLTFFVENHGRLLGKDELMDGVWADSFVEEGNLTFNIRQLRVILNDDAQNPKFIKTVRRHGYRFIADVRQISEPFQKATIADLSEEKPAGSSSAAPSSVKKSFSPALFFLIVVGAVAVIFGAWYLKNRNYSGQSPILSAPFASEKLTTNGKVVLAVISPDGKNVVYTNGAERQSVWLRQIESGDNTEMIPESDQIYFDLAFSPDGDFLYFSRRPASDRTDIGVYRISLFGGVPQKIIDGVLTPIAISPDGLRMAFVRYPRGDEEYCTVQIADAADGSNERKLTSFPKPAYIRDLEFSSDGKRVIIASGQYKNNTNEVDLFELDLTDETRRALTNEKFTDISRIARLPDSSGWLITGSKIPVMNYRFWKISVSGDETAPISPNAEFYDGLSLDSRATRMVAIQLNYDYHIRFFPLTGATEKLGQLDGDTIDIAADGKMYFTSWVSGTGEIWSANPDGSNRRQLTNNKWEEDSPVVSPDGNTIFFSSVQTGKWFIWRMNTDGSNQKQVSFTKGGTPLIVTPDGEWLYFLEHDDSNLWRISLKTGEEQLVLDKKTYLYSYKVSPDGSRTAFIDRKGDEEFINIVGLPAGNSLKTFPIAAKKLSIQNLGWTRDGKNLLYATKDTNTSDFVLWLQPLAENSPRMIADLDDEEMIQGLMPVTPDGKFVAVAQGSRLHDAVLIKGLK